MWITERRAEIAGAVPQRVGGVALLSLLLFHGVMAGSARGDDQPLILVSRESVTPARLEVHIGELVRWRAARGEHLHLDLDRHPEAHEVIRRPGEIRAIFLKPGEHAYTVVLGPAGTPSRGLVVVRQAKSPWTLPPTCESESSDRICFAQ